MSQYLIYNGEMIPSEQPVIHAANRGFRYGDGLFETMRFTDEHIRLADLHFNRLFAGMRALGFIDPGWGREQLLVQIRSLAKKNGYGDDARVRFTVFRTEGTLYEGSDHPQYIIEASAFPQHYLQLNQKGLEIGIYPDARKQADAFSALKTNNYLVYAMAARYAHQKTWDDSLVLNTAGRVADTSISNLFVIRDGNIYTPPVTEGGVAGVMRQWLLQQLPLAGYACFEKEIDPSWMAGADEVFLTNALSGIRWVGKMGSKTFGCSQITEIYNRIFPIPA